MKQLTTVILFYKPLGLATLDCEFYVADHEVLYAHKKLVKVRLQFRRKLLPTWGYARWMLSDLCERKEDGDYDLEQIIVGFEHLPIDKTSAFKVYYRRLLDKYDDLLKSIHSNSSMAFRVGVVPAFNELVELFINLIIRKETEVKAIFDRKP